MLVLSTYNIKVYRDEVTHSITRIGLRKDIRKKYPLCFKPFKYKYYELQSD